MRQIVISVNLLLVALFSVCHAQEGKLTADAAKKLLPAAAGISNADFKALSEDPQADTVKSKSLSLVLLALDVQKIAQKNPEAAKEFRFFGEEYPPPSDIAVVMSISKSKGYASFIQPAYITACTCESNGDRAEGVVSFKSKLFEGRIPFAARATKEGWVITEFTLPQYKTKVIRGKDGVWKQEDLKNK